MRRLHNAELYHGANSMGMSVPGSPSALDGMQDPTFPQNDAVDRDLASDIAAERERLFRSVPPVQSRGRSPSPEYFSDLDANAAPVSRRKRPRVDLRLGQRRVRVPDLDRDKVGPVQQEDGGPGPDYYSPPWMDAQQERQRILENHPDYKFLTMVSGFANRPVAEMYDLTGFLGEQRREQFLRRQQEERLRQMRTDVEQMTRRRRRLSAEIDDLKRSLETLRSDVALADSLMSQDGKTAGDLAHDEKFLARLEEKVKLLETLEKQGGIRPRNFHRDNHDLILDAATRERKEMLDERTKLDVRGLGILTEDLLEETPWESEEMQRDTRETGSSDHARGVHAALVRWWLVEFDVDI